jgi:hypothetical protein
MQGILDLPKMAVLQTSWCIGEDEKYRGKVQGEGQFKGVGPGRGKVQNKELGNRARELDSNLQ